VGKGKIIWSPSAKSKLFEIFDYYASRNKSKTFSVKLYNRFKKDLSNLLKHLELGLKTELDSVRGLIVQNFIFFYEINGKDIIVHTLWDSRQNPDELNKKGS
jgi:addiction module RelE/StbE family toxin